MSNGLEEAKQAITEVCEALKTSDAIPRAIDAFREFLLAKNKAYGNSIYEPVRVFTNASIDTLILVRLNDKATRLLKGESGGEDSFDDLLGYLILRKALPLYLSLDTKEGLEVSDALACGGFERSPVPGHIVTASLKNRGLHVGMTYQEVRDNKWTECEGKRDEHDDAPSCTECDPCSACKFLEMAMCTCGHPFSWHFPSNCGLCQSVGCSAFSLASWTPEPSDEERTTAPPMTDEQRKARAECKGDPCSCDWEAPHGRDPFTECDPSEEISAQSNERNALLAAEAAQPKKEPMMTDTKKQRINRATWHETAGASCIGRVIGLLQSNPQLSWAVGELASRSGFVQSEVGFALRHLIETGAIVQHGKAKGTRYAVAGFTDWPAPTPRKRSESVALTPAGIAAADAAHSLDASDSEET